MCAEAGVSVGAVGAGVELDADMGMNYRGFGLAWLVLWLLMPTLPAGAEILTLGELSLDTANAWQRADAEMESGFDSIVLHDRAEPSTLEIYLTRHRVRLKLAEAKFIEQLEQSWRRRYGAEAELSWLEIAGTRWRVCRRPSRSGDGHIFQIVTVHSGEVYQMVATAPSMIRTLPGPVRAFLASAAWAGVKLPKMREAAGAASDMGLSADSPALSYSWQVVAAGAAPATEAGTPAETSPASVPVTVKPEPTTAKPEPKAAVPEPDQAIPAPAAPVPVTVASEPVIVPPAAAEAASEPAAAESGSAPMMASTASITTTPEAAAPARPARRWHLLRTVIALPGNQAWPALAEFEGGLLGSDALVQGLGLSARAAGIDGFLEGLVWQKGEDEVEHRQPFRRHWLVSWSSFPEHWQTGEDLAFDLDIRTETAGLQPGGDMTLQFELQSVCAPRINVVRWLDVLEARGPVELIQLAGMTCASAGGTPAPTRVTVAAADYPAGAAGQLKKHVVLPLPTEWEQAIRAKSRAEAERLVLTVRFRISEDGHAPGDAMFRRAAVVFVFGPEV